VEVIQQPAFAEKQFKRVRNQILTGIAIQNQDTGAVASQAFNRAIMVLTPMPTQTSATRKVLPDFAWSSWNPSTQPHYGPNGLVLAVCGGIALKWQVKSSQEP
jgi:predicted Zn-dependent peptidase